MIEEKRYYLVRYHKTGEAFAVYDCESNPKGITADEFPIPLVFCPITKPEYETYKEFGMYDVKPGDTMVRLILIAESNIPKEIPNGR